MSIMYERSCGQVIDVQPYLCMPKFYSLGSSCLRVFCNSVFWLMKKEGNQGEF